MWRMSGCGRAPTACIGSYPAVEKENEELLYKSNAPVVLTDWSMDGRYLTYYATDLGGGAIYALPLAGTGERKPIEIFRSKFQLTGPRLSPDDRFVAYVSTETGKTELYVRPFDPAAAPGTARLLQGHGGFPAGRSRHGVLAARQQGDQFPLSPIEASCRFRSPLLLILNSENRSFCSVFPKQRPFAPNMASVNRDADRFVIAVPPPQLRQLTLLDREGKVVGTVGQPGRSGMSGFPRMESAFWR